MTLSIHSLSTYFLEVSSQVSPANFSFSVSQAKRILKQALEGITSSQEEGPSTQDLKAALSTFAVKTLALYQSFQSFGFPEGFLPSRYRTTFVSDPDKLIAEATSDATLRKYLIDIEQIAAGQTNQSKVLVSDEVTELAAGTYTFTLTVGNTSYPLHMEIEKSGLNSDTNKDVLERLGRTISQTDDSLEVFVTETQRRIYSTLSDNMTEKVVYLTVRNTASSDSFSLEDDTGTLIDTMRVNYVAQSGHSSEYRVDAMLSTTDGNIASLDDDHLTLTFLDTTNDSVTAEVKIGLHPLREKISDLILDFNDYMDWLRQNSKYFQPSVKTGILEEIESASSSLRSIGLRFDKMGKIDFGQEFEAALQKDPGAVRQALTGEGGFITQVAKRLSEILQNGVEEYGVSPVNTSINILI